MKKKLIMIGCSVAGVIILGTSIWAAAKGSSSKPVEVVPVSQVSDPGYGNAYSTSGVIRSDSAQEIYLTENDKIKKMYVKEGDEVKVGDKLFSYDTAKMNLEVEIKKLDKELADLKIQGANTKLERLAKEKPYTPPPDEPEEAADQEEDEPEEVKKEKDKKKKKGDKEKKEEEQEAEADEGEVKEKEVQPVQTKEEGGAAEEEGRTREEINKDIEDTKKALRDARLDKKKAQIELRQAEEKLENQAVRKSTVNGIVKTAGDPEEGRPQDGSAFMVISGEEGLYVKGNVDEKVLEKFETGLMVMGYAWEAGIDFTAEVTAISEYPSEDSSYEEGSNTTYYEFTALIEEPGDLKNNDYVDLQVSLDGESTDGKSLYMDKMYIREDDGGQYVWISDESGKLKRQNIKTGKSLWGSFVEIKEGITMEDKIAFPYGKEVKEGARTESPEEEMTEMEGEDAG